MDQSVCKNQSSGTDKAPLLDGKPGQPGTKRYRIGYRKGSFHGVACEAENEEQAADWFCHYFQHYDQQTGAHIVVRIDDLGLMNEGETAKKLPEADFLAAVQEVKEIYLAWKDEVSQEDPIDGQHESLSDSPSSKDKPGQPEIRGYRIWYCYDGFDYLECDANDEKQAAEWFRQWCQKRNDGISIYRLEGVEDAEVAAARIAARVAKLREETMEAKRLDSVPRPTVPCSTEPTGRDYFAALKERKARAKQQT